MTRQSGGTLIFYRDQMTTLSESIFSNSYVDTTMMYSPKTDTAWIVIYRPPNCPAPKFIEALKFINEWILKLKDSLGKTPTICMTGDLNMPSMKSWEIETIEDMTSNSNAREINNKSISEDKEQIMELVSFTQDWSLQQEVKEPTHLGNILDLVFTNNPDMIEEVEVIKTSKNI